MCSAGPLDAIRAGDFGLPVSWIRDWDGSSVGGIEPSIDEEHQSRGEAAVGTSQDACEKKTRDTWVGLRARDRTIDGCRI